MTKKGEIINMEVITTEFGLLYKNGQDIPLPEADALAQMHGFMFTERLVDHLEKGYGKSCQKMGKNPIIF